MNYQSDELNVLFSSDDNYAQHLAAAIYSLLIHNASFNRISIYVIDNEISPESHDKLVQVVNSFKNAYIVFLDFAKWKSKLKLNLAWDISLSSYARLFMGDILPEPVNRALYLDCDMIICGSLYQLWNHDLGEHIIGAVQDCVSQATKTCVGLKKSEGYFNAGMLLVDLYRWREDDIGQRCIEFIEGKNGTVGHHDICI